MKKIKTYKFINILGSAILSLAFLNIYAKAVELRENYEINSSKIYLSDITGDFYRDTLIFDMKNDNKISLSKNRIESILKEQNIDINLTGSFISTFTRFFDFTDLKDELKREFSEQIGSIKINDIKLELQSREFSNEFQLEKIHISKTSLKRYRGNFFATYSFKGEHFKIRFSYELDALIDTYIAKNDISKGSIITDENIKVETAQFKYLNYAVDSLDLNGKYRAKMNIQRDKVLNKNLVELIPMILKNQRVLAILKDGSLTIKFEAISLESGNYGDIIKIKNQNNSILKAKIIDSDRVEVL